MSSLYRVGITTQSPQKTVLLYRQNSLKLESKIKIALEAQIFHVQFISAQSPPPLWASESALYVEIRLLIF